MPCSALNKSFILYGDNEIVSQNGTGGCRCCHHRSRSVRVFNLPENTPQNQFPSPLKCSLFWGPSFRCFYCEIINQGYRLSSRRPHRASGLSARILHTRKITAQHRFVTSIKEEYERDISFSNLIRRKNLYVSRRV